MEHANTLASMGYIVGTPLAQPVMDLVENICLFDGSIEYGELVPVTDSEWQVDFVMWHTMDGDRKYYKRLRFNVLPNGDRQHRIDYTQEDVAQMVEFARQNGIQIPSELEIHI